MKKKLLNLVLATTCMTTLLPALQEDGGVCTSCGQHSFVVVAKKCRPAVVHIRAEMTGGQGGFSNFSSDPNNPFEQFQDELFHRFFGFPSTPRGSAPKKPHAISSGSGFFVSKDGYIVTNYHVVKDASKIIVERYDELEREFEAELVGCDPSTDLAVLKIQGESPVVIEFGNSDQIEVGQSAMAIGHPFTLRDFPGIVKVMSAAHPSCVT